MAGTTSRARAARAPALAAAAVVVVVVLAGALAVTTGGGGDTVSGPQPLRLLAGGGAASSSSAAMSTMPGGAYRLEGELPAGGPEEGVVWQLPAGPADAPDVRRLASALGVTGEPRADGDS